MEINQSVFEGWQNISSRAQFATALFEHGLICSAIPSGNVRLELVEIQLFQTVKDAIDAGEEVPRVEDLIELFLAYRAARVSIELFLERGTGQALLHLAPGSHGVFLHDGVRLLARDTRFHQCEQHL